MKQREGELSAVKITALFCIALLGPDVSRQGTCLIYKVDSAATFRVERVQQNWLSTVPASLAPIFLVPPLGPDITDFPKTGAAGTPPSSPPPPEPGAQQWDFAGTKSAFASK